MVSPSERVVEGSVRGSASLGGFARGFGHRRSGSRRRCARRIADWDLRHQGRGPDRRPRRGARSPGSPGRDPHRPTLRPDPDQAVHHDSNWSLAGLTAGRSSDCRSSKTRHADHAPSVSGASHPVADVPGVSCFPLLRKGGLTGDFGTSAQAPASGSTARRWSFPAVGTPPTDRRPEVAVLSTVDQAL